MNKPNSVSLFCFCEYLGRTSENAPYPFRLVYREKSFYIKAWGPYKKKLRLKPNAFYKVRFSISNGYDAFNIKDIEKADRGSVLTKLEVKDFKLLKPGKDKILAKYVATVLVPFENEKVEVQVDMYGEDNITPTGGCLWCLPNEIAVYDDNYEPIYEGSYQKNIGAIRIISSGREIIDNEEDYNEDQLILDDE